MSEPCAQVRAWLKAVGSEWARVCVYSESNLDLLRGQYPALDFRHDQTPQPRNVTWIEARQR